MKNLNPIIWGSIAGICIYKAINGEPIPAITSILSSLTAFFYSIEKIW